MDPFSSEHGFGKFKELAKLLLKETIELLNKHNVNYFLISGTLLGAIRHNDFIPWDDDIDLLVSSDFITKIPKMGLNRTAIDLGSDRTQIGSTSLNINFVPAMRPPGKYSQRIIANGMNIVEIGKLMYKTCYYPRVFPSEHEWPEKKYWTWPFVDLFIYTECGNELHFFEKNWNSAEFFPATEIDFQGISRVKIPKNPDYFLSINYPDYRTKCVSPNYCHKYERGIGNVTVRELI